MASPPYHHSLSALSPPYPSHSPLPQPLKRRQSDMPKGPSTKRRKASMLSTTSTSSHPLRQTSFPPRAAIKDERYSRSPSFDNMSFVSGVSGTKRKRGQKSKGQDDASSLMGGRAKSALSVGSGKAAKRRATSKEVNEDMEEEEDTSLVDLGVDMVLQTQEERRKEQARKAMFVQALDQPQTERYSAWMSSRLPDAVVRRIINQTLSQSAPANVILAIKSVAKVFLGEMIEGARKVQLQWDENDEEIKELHQKANHPATTALRAPLQPDHLREALRRHKASGDGGDTGQLGLWQLQQHSGVERFASRAGGKRLFK